MQGLQKQKILRKQLIFTGVKKSLLPILIVVLVCISAQIPSIVRAASNLPSPWTDQDVGSVGQAGSASISYTSTGSTYTIAGSGNDIWNTGDAFHYMYQTLQGNGQITAHVDSITNTNPWAKAGVMMRESLAANSANAMMEITAGMVSSFQRRTSTGANSTSTHGPAIHVPYWVKLVRSGSTFTGSISSDGTTWNTVGSTTIPMKAQILIGVAVTAHNNSVLNTATFDTVQATGAPLNGTIVQHSATGQGSGGQPSTATASCQQGEQMVSGGFAISAFETTNVTASYPSGANSWTVTNLGGSVVTAYVNCLQASYTIGTTIEHAPFAANMATVVNCPAGAVVMSGGFQSSNVSVKDSHPTASGWSVTSSSAGTAYVVCATASFAAAPTTSAIFTIPGGFGTEGSGSASCGAGQLIVGSGFTLLGGPAPILYDIYQGAQSSFPGSWTVTFYGTGTQPPTSAQVWATCVITPA